MEAGKPELKLHNTMTQAKEVLKPINPGKIGMYVCGITAYDLSHLGHARASVSFDVLYRYLRHLGYEVTYVRNFTDVDDKVIEKANKLEENPLALSKQYCEEYLVDMKALQCLLPTHQPRVSDHMDHIIKMIEKIIEKDCGYVVDGDVFFSVDKSPNYGQLSGQLLDHTRAGKRVAVDPRKRNPADFALWKAEKPGERGWKSPWGPGRPGWHIECSAMSSHYLSPRFDIHGGGADLKFPHHENEIAQTCAACEDSGVNYWLHNGHVTNNNVKMGKSLHNFFTIREITAKYHPLALRHFLLSAHYRSPLNYSRSQLERSSDVLYYVYQTLQDLVEALSPYQEALKDDNGKAEETAEAKDVIMKVKSEFESKMSDDLNTSPILTGAFQDAMKFINVSIIKLKKKHPRKQGMSLLVSLVEVEKAVREVLDVLGLLTALSYAELLKEMKQKALARAGIGEEVVLEKIEARRIARKNKDFETSDRLREYLAIKGVSLMDISGEDTVWRPCLPSSSQSEPDASQETPS
uniref:cysteine--tRNA ligase n=1 Tax=Noccaea caerulescens TaxID=107243 RepID=A0A1J3JIL3_NOCCA